MEDLVTMVSNPGVRVVECFDLETETTVEGDSIGHVRMLKRYVAREVYKQLPHTS
ncbi:MAG: hypothetical protein IIC70_08445 [Acidobacteria bacterium]|nr:hypothetical protein [Acidobacteriota bacterium]